MTAVLPYIQQGVQSATQIDWNAVWTQIWYGIPVAWNEITSRVDSYFTPIFAGPTVPLQQAATSKPAVDSAGVFSSGTATPTPPSNNGKAPKKTTSTKTSSAINSSSPNVVVPKIVGFTKHGIDSAIFHDGVGVSPKSLLDTISSPKQIIQQSGGVLKLIGNTSVVVLNGSGRVITTWATSSAGIGAP